MNAKHPLYKEKLKVQKEIFELYEIQRNQNWIELEKPYKDGYYKYYDLRDDIKNREDAWVFYQCLELVGHQIWHRDKSFKKKIRKGKYEYYTPGIGYISEEVYNSLNPTVKKQFSEIGPYSKNYNRFRKRYECSVPSYYFVEKIKPRWITHYKEYDSVILKQEEEKEDYLRQGKFMAVGGLYRRTGCPKHYRQSFTRSDRRHSKQTIQKNIKHGGHFYEDFDFDQLEDLEYYEYSYDYDRYEHRYDHKHSATWMWW